MQVGNLSKRRQHRTKVVLKQVKLWSLRRGFCSLGLPSQVHLLGFPKPDCALSIYREGWDEVKALTTCARRTCLAVVF